MKLLGDLIIYKEEKPLEEGVYDCLLCEPSTTVFFSDGNDWPMKYYVKRHNIKKWEGEGFYWHCGDEDFPLERVEPFAWFKK